MCEREGGLFVYMREVVCAHACVFIKSTISRTFVSLPETFCPLSPSWRRSSKPTQRPSVPHLVRHHSVRTCLFLWQTSSTAGSHPRYDVIMMSLFSDVIRITIKPEEDQ